MPSCPSTDLQDGDEALRQVGNYAEIHERNVGARSPLRFARGINALWDDGGVMVPMPLRCKARR